MCLEEHDPLDFVIAPYQEQLWTIFQVTEKKQLIPF